MAEALNHQEGAVTPMLKQYWQIKAEIDDKETILFFRLGDFYEMFFDDARTASRILDITLTSRNKNDPNPVPLCGIPYHSADGYIARLLANGKKVAICEQVEDPRLAKGLVRREVIKIITPGVLLEADGLVASQNNYLAAVSADASNQWALAICDASTGDFRAAVFKNIHLLAQELARIEPREILISRSLHEDQLFLTLRQVFGTTMVTPLNDPLFDPQLAAGFELDQVPKGTYAVIGAIANYLKNTQKADVKHIRRVLPYAVSEHMVIDEATKRNLELTRTLMDGSPHGTMLWLMDRTATAMGGRTIRRWMLYPLLKKEAIDLRLDAVDALKNDFRMFEGLRSGLLAVADIERITSRIVIGSANARELSSLNVSLRSLPSIKSLLKDTQGLLSHIGENLDPCLDLADRIEATIVDEPPLSLKDGGLIKNEVSAQLDELRNIALHGKDFIARLEAQERSRTGINSLKVRYNKVFGYYIEVTNAHVSKAPENYIRKQTLTNAERFITPELKEYEEKVLGAEERSRQLEYEMFSELRNYAAGFAGRLADTADALGQLDALVSLAQIANEHRYVRPKVTTDGELVISGGRHPIIERLNLGERFVPNDTMLNMDDCRMMIITGPNMAGKSTVMRQVALIVLMAQMGSFVPAAEARISVVDRIFTRVGASDNLVKGQSTFMVEMTETATILKEATAKSFILIDEIGRGTSTYDGVSIAWAVAEFIHDNIGAKTMFATHYHELTDLVLTKKGIKNFNIAVKEWNDQVIFLRKLISGGVNRSYGIQVARLAGLPQEVINGAKEILGRLEKGEMALRSGSSRQMFLFDGGQPQQSADERPDELIDAIKRIDTTVLTPIEALNILHELKQKV